MRVLTFNIHKGFNWSNKKLTIQYLKDQLRDVHPELVFLQEVVGENLELAKTQKGWVENQFEYLADELWTEFAYAKNAVYDKRHHGNVILSKYPIIETETIDISTNSFEQRGVLFCRLEVEKKFLDCYCVHLDLTQKGREKQYDSLQEIIARKSDHDSKIIIAGDFNDWNQKACDYLIQEDNFLEAHKFVHGQYAKTFPAQLPMLCLDRMYTRGLNIRNIQVLKTKPWKSISDHLPLLAEVDL